MKPPILLALDVGTHAARVVLYSVRGEEISNVQMPIALQRMGDSMVEQDGEEILSACNAVLQQSLGSHVILGAGLCTQRSTVIAWDKVTGEALTPALSWLDTRGRDLLSSMVLDEEMIHLKTGLRVSPHFGASKLQWLLQNNVKVQSARVAGTLLMGPLSSFLTFRLTKEPLALVDYGNAARTLLWNLQLHDWDDELLELFSIPRDVLPVCIPSSSSYGTLLCAGIPLLVVNGDQNSAVYGNGKLQPETAIGNIGSGAFIVSSVGEEPLCHPYLLTSVGRSSKDSTEYILEGTVNGAGTAFSWAKDRWQQDLVEIDSSRVEAPPLFVNTVGGLGSPWWKSGISPYFPDGEDIGIEEKKSSILESIVFLLVSNLGAMEGKVSISQLQVSGGVSQDSILCQKLANLSQHTVQRFKTSEFSARGTAWQVAMQFGMVEGEWGEEAEATFLPLPDTGLIERYKRLREIVHEL